MKRLLLFVSLVIPLWTAERIWVISRQPEISTALAVLQINNGSAAAAQLREFETFKETLTDATAVLTFLAAFLCFDSLVRDCLGIVMRSALRSRRAHVLTLLLPASLAFVNFV